MNVTKNTWYVRWFQYNCVVLDRFTNKYVATTTCGGIDSYRLERYQSGTNLCHFMRTLFFGSLVMLATLVGYGVILTTLFMPFYLIGTFKVAVVVGVTVALIAILIATIYLLLVVFPKMFHATRNSLHNMVTIPSDGNPTMIAVIWQWLIGVKNKFCPTITFKN
jgi:hypothetical protein